MFFSVVQTAKEISENKEKENNIWKEEARGLYSIQRTRVYMYTCQQKRDT